MDGAEDMSEGPTCAKNPCQEHHRLWGLDIMCCSGQSVVVWRGKVGSSPGCPVVVFGYEI